MQFLASIYISHEELQLNKHLVEPKQETETTFHIQTCIQESNFSMLIAKKIYNIEESTQMWDNKELLLK